MGRSRGLWLVDSGGGFADSGGRFESPNWLPEEPTTKQRTADGTDGAKYTFQPKLQLVARDDYTPRGCPLE